MTDHMSEAERMLDESHKAEPNSSQGALVYATRAQARASMAIADAVDRFTRTPLLDEETLASRVADAIGSRVKPIAPDAFAGVTPASRTVLGTVEPLEVSIAGMDVEEYLELHGAPVLLEVLAEQKHARDDGWTVEHDDEHDWTHFAVQITDYLEQGMTGRRDPRRALLIVAQLAVSGIESYDRTAPERAKRAKVRAGDYAWVREVQVAVLALLGEYSHPLPFDTIQERTSTHVTSPDHVYGALFTLAEEGKVELVAGLGWRLV